jgi:hypothetical protein
LYYTGEYYNVDHGGRHNWTGLLVEAHPLSYAAGLYKQRKAYTINTCLSTETKPQIVNFDTVGSIRNETHRSGDSLSSFCTSKILPQHLLYVTQPE